MRCVDRIKLDEFVRDEPDRLALSVRADPRLVAPPCPRPYRLRTTRVSTLDRRCKSSMSFGRLIILSPS